MYIVSKTDALGALGAAKSVVVFHNDSTDDIALNVITTGGATVTDSTDSVTIGMGLNSTAKVEVKANASHVVKPGGKLIITKLTAVGTYTPQAEVDWEDAVFLKQATINYNSIVSREMNYWHDVAIYAGLGLGSIAGMAATATVNVNKLSDEALTQIENVDFGFGRVNVIG